MNDIFKLNSDHILLLEQWMTKFDGLVAGFTTRLGGVSTAHFSTNNLGLHVNDDEQAVIANRKRLASRLGFSFDSFTCAEQIHSNVVADVTVNEVGRGRNDINDTILGADAIVTSLNDTLLVSFYADCVPLLFVDPHKKVIALAHAGWKGTVGAIAKQTVCKMVEQYGCDVTHIYAAIGPAISDCCYEVDQKVIQAVKQLWQEEDLDELVLFDYIKPISEEKALINLKEINRQIMIKAGILSAHIEISKMCTGCSTNLFFSHRMEHGKTGRMASFIGWQERK